MNLGKGTLAVTLVVPIVLGGVGIGIAWGQIGPRLDATEATAAEAAKAVRAIEREQVRAEAERLELHRDLAQAAVQTARDVREIKDELRTLREALVSETGRARRR